MPHIIKLPTATDREYYTPYLLNSSGVKWVGNYRDLNIFDKKHTPLILPLLKLIQLTLLHAEVVLSQSIDAQLRLQLMFLKRTIQTAPFNKYLI